MFLDIKTLRPGGIDLFGVCLVSIGCSLLFICFYQIFQDNLEKKTFLRPIPVLIIFLFCFARLFYLKGGFLVA